LKIVMRTVTVSGSAHYIGNSQAHRDYDFQTRAAGDWYDGSGMVHAVIWYPYGPSFDFPELGVGGRTAVAGPILRRPDPDAPYQWSAKYLDKWIIMEWSRNWVKMVTLDESGSRALAIADFLTEGLSRPTAVVQGPDGARELLASGTARDQRAPDA